MSTKLLPPDTARAALLNYIAEIEKIGGAFLMTRAVDALRELVIDAPLLLPRPKPSAEYQARLNRLTAADLEETAERLFHTRPANPEEIEP